MKRIAQLFTFALVMSATLSSFASSPKAPVIRFRKISRLTAPQEMPTRNIIDVLKKEIETRCSALSSSDSVEILSEKIVDVTPYGGRTIITGRIECPNSDLPCIPEQGYIVDQLQLRDLEISMVRKNGGQRYHIKAKTRWGFDLPVPMVDVALESRYCR